mgnify:FL=1
MKDQKTLAYINLFGILGALGKLAELDDAARALLTGIKPIALGIAVSGGPHATLRFADGGCTQTEGVDRCDIKLAFSTAEKFNGMIDGTVTPIPRKGFTHIGFLTGTFVKLTDILTRYLRPSAEDLADERFFEVSTTLMLYVIAGAVAQIGNHDEVGRFSASNIVDGDVLLSIKGGPQATVTARDHVLSFRREGTANPRAVMEFASIRLARDLFDGRVNAMACIGRKEITVGGVISMLDNVNRILDRVALYLA